MTTPIIASYPYDADYNQTAKAIVSHSDNGVNGIDMLVPSAEPDRLRSAWRRTTSACL